MPVFLAGRRHGEFSLVEIQTPAEFSYWPNQRWGGDDFIGPRTLFFLIKAKTGY